MLRGLLDKEGGMDAYELFRDNPVLFVQTALKGYTLYLSKEQYLDLVAEIGEHIPVGFPNNPALYNQDQPKLT
jgi:hypothetical protein